MVEVTEFEFKVQVRSKHAMSEIHKHTILNTISESAWWSDGILCCPPSCCDVIRVAAVSPASGHRTCLRGRTVLPKQSLPLLDLGLLHNTFLQLNLQPLAFRAV
jgi:hypothetical protein